MGGRQNFVTRIQFIDYVTLVRHNLINSGFSDSNMSGVVT
jgi:hypothetical protein